MPSEADSIAAVERPATVSSLRADLERLGLADGSIAIVHSSLSSIGWVAGGAQAVVQALLEAVGSQGTVVMPTQSGQLSDPADWEDPPVPPEWHEAIRSGFPAYDPNLTTTRGMGAVVETFRCDRGTMRSAHPLSSFAAYGPAADEIVGDHPIDDEFGERSPLARLHDLDADVLLIGVDHGSNTSLHLAEHRADWMGKDRTERGAPVAVDGETRWVTWTDLEADEEDFPEIGEAFAATGAETVGNVGIATARRCSQRAIVDFAVEWMSANRGPRDG